MKEAKASGQTEAQDMQPQIPWEQCKNNTCINKTNVVHEDAQETTLRYLYNLGLTQEMIIKSNRLQELANLKEIQV